MYAVIREIAHAGLVLTTAMKVGLGY